MGRWLSQFPLSPAFMDEPGQANEVRVAFISQTRRWLTRPVIEDSGFDRPFRLRRASLLLLVGGWAVFLGSILIGAWLVHQRVPLHGIADLWGGGDFIVNATSQWARHAAEAVGAASFFAGLASVPLFDRRDRIPVWRVD